ncbi:hypothetical protein U1Q18_015443 [Sarracenia purpurea var. burkii]
MAVCSAPVGLASWGLVSGLGSALFRASDPRFAKLLLADPRGEDYRSGELTGQIVKSGSANYRGIAGTWGSEASPDVLLAVATFWILTIPQRPLLTLLRPCSWKIRDRLGVISGALEATRLRLSPSSDSRETREPFPWPAGGIIGRDIMSGFHRRHRVSPPAFTSVDGVVGSGACFVFLFSSMQIRRKRGERRDRPPINKFIKIGSHRRRQLMVSKSGVLLTGPPRSAKQGLALVASVWYRPKTLRQSSQ